MPSEEGMMLTQEAQIILLSDLFIKIGAFFFAVEDSLSSKKQTMGLLDATVPLSRNRSYLLLYLV